MSRHKVVDKEVSSYSVDYVRDEARWWVASVRTVKGCHSQGRTLGEARRRVREALGLFVDDADAARLVDRVHLPASVKQALRRYRTSRRRAAREQAANRSAAAKAVQLLVSRPLRLSVRDAADLLEVSHQRVHQLMRS